MNTENEKVRKPPLKLIKSLALRTSFNISSF